MLGRLLLAHFSLAAVSASSSFLILFVRFHASVSGFICLGRLLWRSHPSALRHYDCVASARLLPGHAKRYLLGTVSLPSLVRLLSLRSLSTAQSAEPAPPPPRSSHISSDQPNGRAWTAVRQEAFLLVSSLAVTGALRGDVVSLVFRKGVTGARQTSWALQNTSVSRDTGHPSTPEVTAVSGQLSCLVFEACRI